MRTVYAKHEPYEDGQLANVVEEMRIQGPPTVRVVERDGLYFALEASHRLAAAHHLGIQPRLVVVTPEADETLETFWARVAPQLPIYDFPCVHVLHLAAFEVP
jgi:hypothetical protein